MDELIATVIEVDDLTADVEDADELAAAAVEVDDLTADVEDL